MHLHMHYIPSIYSIYIMQLALYICRLYTYVSMAHTLFTSLMTFYVRWKGTHSSGACCMCYDKCCYSYGEFAQLVCHDQVTMLCYFSHVNRNPAIEPPLHIVPVSCKYTNSIRGMPLCMRIHPDKEV